MIPDVRKARRPEKPVDHRMEHHIAVAVAQKARRILQAHPGEEEGPSLHEAMDVETEPDSRCAIS